MSNTLDIDCFHVTGTKHSTTLRAFTLSCFEPFIDALFAEYVHTSGNTSIFNSKFTDTTLCDFFPAA